MARLIDADLLWQEVRDNPDITGRTYEAVKEHILGAKTVDAVEVVRCGKCKWWDPDSEYCQFWHGVRHPGHHCGEGKKK